MAKLAPDAVQHDYAKTPLARKDVEALLAAAGSVAAVLNARHATAKAHGWKDDPPSKAVFVKAVLEEPNLLRRPILVRGTQAVVGADLAALRALLA